MQATLVILAAGMGSRYGGLKQLDPMGPGGETVLDYSVYDAIRAGFSKVVFVIRRDFAAAFEATVVAKFADRIETACVFQELGDLPAGFTVPAGRTKPWGTAHAVRAARNAVDGPFAVINADDFYGRDAYARLAAHFQTVDAERLHCAMVAYPLENTLSEHGSVNRGLCRLSGQQLETVVEHTEIRREADGRIRGATAQGERTEIPDDTAASMNFWGFTPPFFDRIETAFVRFLEQRGGEEKSECYLPAVVDALIRKKACDCTVLETSASWFGVTYPEDKPLVQAAIRGLVASGEYPGHL